jgi:hypothetical protein
MMMGRRSLLMALSALGGIALLVLFLGTLQAQAAPVTITNTVSALSPGQPTTTAIPALITVSRGVSYTLANFDGPSDDGLNNFIAGRGT